MRLIVLILGSFEWGAQRLGDENALQVVLRLSLCRSEGATIATRWLQLGRYPEANGVHYA